MKKLALLLLVFFIHVEASESTQAGTFGVGASSKKAKIAKKYRVPVEEAKTYQIDINESEIEGIMSEPSTFQIQKEAGGVVLPFDKVDEKRGVVLPMDKKEKNGFFSLFGF